MLGIPRRLLLGLHFSNFLGHGCCSLGQGIHHHPGNFFFDGQFMVAIPFSVQGVAELFYLGCLFEATILLLNKGLLQIVNLFFE